MTRTSLKSTLTFYALVLLPLGIWKFVEIVIYWLSTFERRWV